MKVLVLSDVAAHGGAAMVANALHEQFSREVESVRRYVIRHNGDKNYSFAIPSDKYINFALYRGRENKLFQGLAEYVSLRLLERQIREIKPDLINLHNVHAAFNGVNVVELCLRYAPTVWTLHDMWSFTGRCAYSAACTAYKTGCDHNCPTASARPALPPSKIRGAWLKRQSLISNQKRLVGVSPSRWLADCANSGIWGEGNIKRISNGVDLSVFRNISREAAREALDVSAEKPIVATYVGIKNDPFKTPEMVEGALSHLRHDVTVLAFGPGVINVPKRHNYVQLGSISNQKMLSIVYASADIFVLPSLNENFPTVLLESISCGTPIVGFNVGGVSEIAEGGVGVIAKDMSAQSLASAMDVAIECYVPNGEVRRVCRNKAEANYSIEKQANCYLDLFRSVLRD